MIADQDKLKRWLCLSESRESDCLVINNGSGLLQSGSIECNGIETDIVVQVYAVCESGKCKNSTLNPVVSTRAKAKLIITKFKMEECEKCGYSSKTAIQSNLALRNVLIRNKLALRNFLWITNPFIP